MSMLSMARSGLNYLGANPMFVVTAARNAVKREITVPLDLLRSLIDRRPRGKGPERIEIRPIPPALGVGLTVDLYGTKLDVASTITVEKIAHVDEALKVSLRVRDLQVSAPPNSPAAMMVGSLDLKHPGSLIRMMPSQHAVLIEANDDLFVLDLFKVRALGENKRLRHVLRAVSDAVAISHVSTHGEHLVIGLHVSPMALPGALMRLGWPA